MKNKDVIKKLLNAYVDTITNGNDIEVIMDVNMYEKFLHEKGLRDLGDIHQQIMTIFSDIVKKED